MLTGFEGVRPSGQLTVLPEQLASIVTPQQMRQNERAVLDMAPEVAPAALQVARLALLRVPLIHGTKTSSAFEKGILPYAEVVATTADDLEELVGMTFTFDKSLGLDKCVFFSWPLPQNPRDYKGGRWLLASSDLLLDDHCFVTPKDVYDVATCMQDEYGNAVTDDTFSDEEWTQLEGVYEEVYDNTYEDLINGPGHAFDYDGVRIPIAVVKAYRERIRQQFSNLYFTKIVSGAVWLEYIARLLAAQGPDDLPLGEIKFTGTVPPSKIETILGDKEFVETHIPHVMQSLALSIS